MGFISDMIRGGPERDEEVRWSTMPQSEEAKKARKRLYAISEEPLPTVPLRGVAPLRPMTEERTLARDTAKELIQPRDIFSLPEVQGIIMEAMDKGNLLANRIGRALQTTGNFTTTAGRDVLGRVVTDVQKNLASSLAPFAAEERARRRGLIPVLEGLGLTEEDRARGISQAELDALFQKETIESNQVQTFLIPLLRAIIADQPQSVPYMHVASPSTSSMIAGELGGGLGPILGLVAGGPAGGLGGLIGNLFRQPTAEQTMYSGMADMWLGDPNWGAP